MTKVTVFSLIIGIVGTLADVSAAEPVYSGLRPGEKTTPFKVLDLTGPGEGPERDPITESGGQPTALVFVHSIERSLEPLLRVIDEYGRDRSNWLRTEVVFLVSDRIEGRQRVRAMVHSLQLKSRVGISLDGIEGPANYGLNKNCMMTILAAKDNKVTANFALPQPSIADAPKVIEALARVRDDASPPTAAQLSERQTARDARIAPDAPGMGRDVGQIDFSRFDLSSEAGLRDALRALMTEMNRLRTEVAALQDQISRTQSTAETGADPASPPDPTTGGPPSTPFRSELPLPPPRPRTVAEARRQQGVVVSRKMEPDGGVRRMAIVPSFDVRATPFAAYDEAIIAAVQQRWYDLLDARKYAGAQEGKVALKFRLNYDGRVSDMKAVETTVSESLTTCCKRAVLDASPYAPWPSDLRRLISGKFRDLQWTFYY